MIERISRFLRSIESRSVEPGRWEGHCTRQALQALNNGDIEEAESRMNLAKVPPELRTFHIVAGFAPEGHSPTIAELRAELERIRGHGTGGPRDND